MKVWVCVTESDCEIKKVVDSKKKAAVNNIETKTSEKTPRKQKPRKRKAPQKTGA